MSPMTSESIKTTDDHWIHYDLYRWGHEKVVIVAPGFFNSKDALLLKELGQALEDQYDVLIMDFRGHCKSGGLFYWTSKEHLDLRAVVDHARKNYKKVGVIGFSLGAATSIIAASEKAGIDTVIAVSAPTEFEKIEYRFWELDVENDIFYNLTGEGRVGKGVKPGPFWLKKDKPIHRVEQIKCPIFYIHGEADWLIKPWHSEELYKKTPTQKRLAIIKNGPHAEYLVRKNKEELVVLIKEWFKETL